MFVGSLDYLVGTCELGGLVLCCLFSLLYFDLLVVWVLRFIWFGLSV